MQENKKKLKIKDGTMALPLLRHDFNPTTLCQTPNTQQSTEQNCKKENKKCKKTKNARKQKKIKN